jgi:hypothetical protein
MSFLGWNSDSAYGVDDGTGDKSIHEEALPGAFIAIPSAKNKVRVFSISESISRSPFTVSHIQPEFVGRTNFCFGKESIYGKRIYHGFRSRNHEFSGSHFRPSGEDY